MKLVFFAPLVRDGDRQIHNVLHEFTAVSDLEIYRTIESFSARLHRPHNEPIVTVLFSLSHDILKALVSIRELLLDTRIILVLPDRNADTIALGHRLHPRFVTYADTGSAEIAEVIRKILDTNSHSLSTATPQPDTTA